MALKREFDVDVLFEKTVKNCRLVVAGGSVVDFSGDCIVNAANSGGLGGGGVDGAINKAGGEKLRIAREALPILEENASFDRARPVRGDIRIPCGEARITIGGDLAAKWVAHAVGPAFTTAGQSVGPDDGPYTYKAEQRELEEKQLRTAYQESLRLARENGATSIGFSLLSAGIFRGPRTVDEVLTIGWNAVENWVGENATEDEPVKEEDRFGVFFVAFTPEEQEILVRIASDGKADFTPKAPTKDQRAAQERGRRVSDKRARAAQKNASHKSEGGGWNDWSGGDWGGGNWSGGNWSGGDAGGNWGVSRRWKRK
eukprot:GEMP01055425.1.p1 GENE.GEMP01055425.1~~GEMP01055425.1.p1  ORF type:complete len:314 (+),score=84.47 GEMP01055425.1:119-1060(+)